MIKVVSYMGKLGFNLRRWFPKTTSFLFLNAQAFLREKDTRKEIENLMKQDRMIPSFINIETINRCNGHCPFCPANVKDETRPLKKMTDELFYKIIGDLEEIGYDNVISLYINNEPFLDTRMPEMLSYVREHLPKATVLVFTNGTLLAVEKLQKIAGKFDRMYINNYNAEYKLLPSSQVIYDYVKAHEEDFKDCQIDIQMRYANEYLANRAGTAPNKPASKKEYKWPCIMPYTDMSIFPDGTVGLCCNDTKEITNFGNVENENLVDVFNNAKLRELREAIKDGRQGNDYCKCCDVIDSGIRLRYLSEKRV